MCHNVSSTWQSMIHHPWLTKSTVVLFLFEDNTESRQNFLAFEIEIRGLKNTSAVVEKLWMHYFFVLSHKYMLSLL